MREEKQLSILLVAVFLIGAAGLFITGNMPGLASVSNQGYDRPVYVEDYRADFYLNGTLAERYDYQINQAGKYRMLYRNWKVPLTDGNLSQPYVEIISINPPENTIAYFKNQLGKVETTKTNNRTNPIISGYSTIESLALPNEAGCFNPNRFGSGRYEISYLFKLHPPVEVDEKYSHLNLKLLDEHLPYRNMEVTIHDPGDLIEQIFTHPPMASKKEGDSWIITGSSPENSLMELEMLLKPEASKVIPGFPRNVYDVEGQTLSANSAYSSNYALASNLFNGLRALVLLFPLLLLLIYYRFGREKSYTVPKTLSYVPGKIKPWIVNLVFKGDAFDFDQDGFYATLLDLSRQGVLDLESEPSLRIKLIKDTATAEDSYESKVLSFLKIYSRMEYSLPRTSRIG